MGAADTTLAELFSLCPDFVAAWEHERSLWTDANGVVSVHGVFATFSHCIADRLSRGDDQGLHEVFDYVEGKLIGEDSDRAATSQAQQKTPRGFWGHEGSIVKTPAIPTFAFVALSSAPQA